MACCGGTSKLYHAPGALTEECYVDRPCLTVCFLLCDAMRKRGGIRLKQESEVKVLCGVLCMSAGCVRFDPNVAARHQYLGDVDELEGSYGHLPEGTTARLPLLVLDGEHCLVLTQALTELQGLLAGTEPQLAGSGNIIRLPQQLHLCKAI